MKSIGKNSRVNNALQVIQHMQAGMSLVGACRVVGMPRSSFYNIVDTIQKRLLKHKLLLKPTIVSSLGNPGK